MSAFVKASSCLIISSQEFIRRYAFPQMVCVKGESYMQLTNTQLKIGGALAPLYENMFGRLPI